MNKIEFINLPNFTKSHPTLLSQFSQSTLAFYVFLRLNLFVELNIPARPNKPNIFRTLSKVKYFVS